MALKATPVEQARLLDVQAIDTRLQQLDHRAKNLPELATLRALATEAERLRSRRSAELGALDDARAELTRIESDVALVEARITRDRQRLQSSSSVKDVAGLESELAGLERRRNDLEEIELVVMERVEAQEAEAAASEAEHAALGAKIAETEAARHAAAGDLGGERHTASATRAALVATLPDELVALYERQRQRYGFGASLLRGGVSGASGVKLLENELAVVRAAAPDDVLICPDSQAILVRTEESGL